MRNYLRFIVSAIWHRRAYIDFDGTLSRTVLVGESFVAGGDNTFLSEWQRKVNSIHRTRLVMRHILLLLALRAFGVNLYLWTNRGSEMRAATLRSIGGWRWLFDGVQFYSGEKSKSMPGFGPIIDDEAKYVALSPVWGSLLVTRR